MSLRQRQAGELGLAAILHDRQEERMGEGERERDGTDYSGGEGIAADKRRWKDKNAGRDRDGPRQRRGRRGRTAPSRLLVCLCLCRALERFERRNPNRALSINSAARCSLTTPDREEGNILNDSFFARI